MEPGPRALSFLLLGAQCLCAQQFARASREAMPHDAQFPFPTTSALVDLDGDGALDVVFSATRYYHNDGRGRFTVNPLPALPAGTAFLATGDFDADGDLDVLMTGWVLENRGTAGPAAVSSNTNGIYGRILAVGDLNGDGRDDLVSTGGVSIATSLSTFTTTGVGIYAFITDAAIRDLDGDGDRDIVWATSPLTFQGPWGPITVPGHEQVSFNNGSGTFGAGVLFPNTPDDSTTDVVALDADGDGDADCGFLSGYSWLFWRNQGGGVFAPWSGLPFAPQPLAVHDLDRDGDPDLVGDDRWYENGGAGVFTERSIALRSSPLLALGDVDGDLDIDLVYGGLGIPNRDHRLLLNQGSQDFVDATAAAWNATTSVANRWRRGDLDGDGFTDLLEMGGLLWRGRGDGWHEPTPLPLAFVPGPGLMLVDLDTDGDLDLLDGSSAQINNGTGTFVYAPITVTPWNAVYPRWAFDADGDGDADLLDIAHAGVLILRNEGALQFTALPAPPLPTSFMEAVAVADFDGDADLDILIGFFDGSIHRWVNDGTGIFTHDPAVVVGAPSTAVATLAIADLDVDGDPDVLVGRYLGTAPRHLVLRNNGGVLVADPTAVPAQDAAVQAALGDVDGDGDPDAVVGFATGSSPPFSLALWINDGTGRFTFAEDLGLPFDDAVELDDVDDDGDADLFAGFRLSLNRQWHFEAPFVPQTGTVYTVRCGGRAMPNALALPFFGARAHLLVPGIGILGVDPATAISLNLLLLSGEMGETSFAIPPGPALVGLPFSMQAVLLSGNTLHLTPPKHEIVRS